MDRILFGLTSHADLGETGKKTGAHLAEITHAYEILKTAGFEIDFLSPKGGQVPLDHADLDDAMNEKWMNNEIFKRKLEHSLTPNQVNPRHYKAIFYPGGHGAMWDLPSNLGLAHLAEKIYADGGVIASVCHGGAALIPIQVDGRPIVQGQVLTCFSNREEVAVGLVDVVPFLLEEKLQELGATLSRGNPFQTNVVVSGRLITGQNPASARQVGEEIRRQLSGSVNAFARVDDHTISP